MIKNNIILNQDCLNTLPNIPNESIPFILCDLPYGVTECKWDVVLNLQDLWQEYRRILTPTGTIALFATYPFGYKLVSYAMDLFKYEWVWTKNLPTTPGHARNRPMQKHENILVFSKGAIAHKNLSKRRMVYNPQGLVQIEKIEKNIRDKGDVVGSRPNQTGKRYVVEHTNYPNTLLRFDSVPNGGRLNPTQKPVALCEYLIKTYTNPDDVVLDNCAGSGTTGAAAHVAGRPFILIEKDIVQYQRLVERFKDLQITFLETLEEFNDLPRQYV
jgi:site-specific DNA-methyltransferase (adenine-specific)